MAEVKIAVVSAIIALIISSVTLFGIFARVVRWVDRQKQQDDELASIRLEQSIITVGVLACLKSIVGEKDEKEVRSAINLIENHLNEQAHK